MTTKKLGRDNVVVWVYGRPRSSQRGGIGSENEAKHTSQRGWEANRSGNDATGSGGVSTSLELDRDILVSDGGVSGEDVEDGGEGVHL